MPSFIALGHDMGDCMGKKLKKFGYLISALFWLVPVLLSLSKGSVAAPPAIELPKIVTENKWWDKVILDVTANEPTSAGTAAKWRQVAYLNNISYDDPMAFPGINNGSPHAHCFYGSVGVNENSTHATIAKSKSSFQGGIFNRSSLWLECIQDATGKLVFGDQMLLYYLGDMLSISAQTTAEQRLVELQVREDFPVDLEMIFNPQKTIINEVELIKAGHLIIYCRNLGTTADPLGEVVTKKSIVGEIPICTDAESLAIKVKFPSCFDDRSKSSDGSHVAYPNTGDWRSANLINHCPSTHPRRTWGVFVFINIPVPAGTTTEGWRLTAPFHLNYHHAFLDNKLTPPLWKIIVDDCFRSPHDCGTGLLGKTHTGLRSLPIVK